MCNKIIQFDTINSTSTYLLDNAGRLPAFTAVCANFQTNGRGRTGRSWSSDNGQNVLFSVLIKGDMTAHFDKISLAVAVAVKRVLDNLGIVNVTVKWPNDVFIGDCKVCGVLLESRDIATHLVVGVGLNVNQTEFAGTRYEATSIAKVLEREQNVAKIRKLTTNSVIAECKRVAKGTSRYLQTVRDNNYLLDKHVTAEVDGATVTGIVVGIADDNSLILRCGSGQTVFVTTGEVTLLVE